MIKLMFLMNIIVARGGGGVAIGALYVSYRKRRGQDLTETHCYAQL